jgi:tryptophan halogenase
LLRSVAERAGVQRIEGELADATLHPESGLIEAVELRGGERVAGDLFFDCTGADAKLIGGALGSDFEDWSNWLACDSVVAVRATVSGDPLPYRRIEAETAGWRWRIPLRTGGGFGHVYSSGHLSDEEAEVRLLEDLDGTMAGEPRRLRFRSGRRSRMWERNCIAIGPAACVLDPIEPTAIQIVLEGLRIFLNLMPDKSFAAGEAEEYNRLMSETVERMRDFVILHYKATGRDDSLFWAQAAAMEVPELLAHKLRLFEARGFIQLLDEETFVQPDWAAVYFGQEMPPRAYDALAEVEDARQTSERLRAMRAAIRAAAEAMPDHRRFIEAGLTAVGAQA